jgi:2-oxoisovalerate dehydrogenase E1 component
MMFGNIRKPWLVHAKVCLLNHHTSGVRKEFYRTEEDLANMPAIGSFCQNSEMLLLMILERSIYDELENRRTGKRNVLKKQLPHRNLILQKLEQHVFVPTPVQKKKVKEPCGKRKSNDGGCSFVCHS